MGSSLTERLAVMPQHGLPLAHPVTIRWNDKAVPHLEAETDGDLAFALGLVHAHLREGLLALGKRIAYGRLSEIAGPFAGRIDQTLRIIGFGHTASLIEPSLPSATRDWLQRFADGLNHYQAHAPAPPEARLLGLRREAWTVQDLLAIGRAAGADINWGSYFGLIRLRDRPDWPVIWQRALRAGAGGITSFRPRDQRVLLAGLLGGFARSGSNCVVVGADRSTSGGALLAADPHLSLSLPNLWILAGVRAPSLRAVGLMPAGLPIFGLGRSARMAWGGTNMRAAASDLIALRGEPDSALMVRIERLRTRFLGSRSIRIRASRFGPVISDAPLFRARKGERIALRWTGREASDEIGAFLAVARARTPEDFRAALASYGVGGQNMQFADAAGNIGQVMAVWLPRRREAHPKGLVLDPADPASEWDGFATAAELPWEVNPEAGYLATANNRPADCAIPVGYFFVTPERIERLHALLDATPRTGLEELRALQLDVTSPAARRLSAVLVEALAAEGLAPPTGLAGWNGRYGVEDRAPVLFETLLRHVAAGLGGARRREWSELAIFLAEDLAALPSEQRSRLFRRALRAAARDAARFPDWGAMHRMRVRHLAARLPLTGRRFDCGEYGVSGSRETVMKTAHGLLRSRHAATYGSQARFLADMADPDATYAVLFGGQDGWIGSANFADQIPLWRRGETIRLPMTPSLVAAEFPIVQRLLPA